MRRRALLLISLIVAIAGFSACTGSSRGVAHACGGLTVAHPLHPPPVGFDRPPMGYNPYNTFGAGADQKTVAAIVRAMAANGMRDAGYRYLNLDDGWQGSRMSSGTITADAHRFPCGLAALARFVHEEGFHFGIYTTPAAQSCVGRTGSAGHEAADARTFAGWGVDYIKLDWCGADYSPAGAAAITARWRAALNAIHRPIVFAINAGGDASVATWAHTIVTNWRVSDDICGSWDNQARPPSATARACYDRIYHKGVADYLTSPVLRREAAFAGPGHYIDPDMLEVGTQAASPAGRDLPGDALTADEATTNFSIWAMWSAPLVVGNDPRSMNGTDVASRILLNREIIAVDQDSLGRVATPAFEGGTWQIWRKPMTGGRIAIAVVNLADNQASGAFTWDRLGITTRPADLRDVWAHRDLPVADALGVQVGAHGTAVFVATP